MWIIAFFCFLVMLGHVKILRRINLDYYIKSGHGSATLFGYGCSYKKIGFEYQKIMKNRISSLLSENTTLRNNDLLKKINSQIEDYTLQRKNFVDSIENIKKNTET